MPKIERSRGITAVCRMASITHREVRVHYGLVYGITARGKSEVVAVSSCRDSGLLEQTHAPELPTGPNLKSTSLAATR